MNGIWILLVLIITAALPAIIVFLWLRARKSPVTLPWFAASLAVGIISLLVAALIQSLIPPSVGIFLRIALVEEASRLIVLFPLLKAGNRRQIRDRTFGATLGFAAGLSFAAIESASYGMADINITLLRAISAAPLHGACGIRAGAAVLIARRRPIKALGLFISTVIIHWAYNMIAASPALPSVLAIPAAFTALFASLPFIKNPGKDDENILTQ